MAEPGLYDDAIKDLGAKILNLTSKLETMEKDGSVKSELALLKTEIADLKAERKELVKKDKPKIRSIRDIIEESGDDVDDYSGGFWGSFFGGGEGE